MCSVQPILRRSNTFPSLYSPVWYATHTATPARARTGGKPFGWRAIARRYSLGRQHGVQAEVEQSYGRHLRCGCMVEYGKKQSFRAIVPAGHQPFGQLFPERDQPPGFCLHSLSHIHKARQDINNLSSDVSR